MWFRNRHRFQQGRWVHVPPHKETTLKYDDDSGVGAVMKSHSTMHSWMAAAARLCTHQLSNQTDALKPRSRSFIPITDAWSQNVGAAWCSLVHWQLCPCERVLTSSQSTSHVSLFVLLWTRLLGLTFKVRKQLSVSWQTTRPGSSTFYSRPAAVKEPILCAPHWGWGRSPPQRPSWKTSQYDTEVAISDNTCFDNDLNLFIIYSKQFNTNKQFSCPYLGSKHQLFCPLIYVIFCESDQ